MLKRLSLGLAAFILSSLAIGHYFLPFTDLPAAQQTPVVLSSSAPVTTVTARDWVCITAANAVQGGAQSTRAALEPQCGALIAGDGVSRRIAERVTSTTTTTQQTLTPRASSVGGTGIAVTAAQAQMIVVAGGGGASPAEDPPVEASSACEGQSNLHYVRDGGSGDGSAWNNALDALPSSLTRGHSYYVADGTYASYTLDDNLSSTTVINICKASVADHGTDTGWLDTYGDGQAIFGSITCNKGYYVLDGAYRDEADWDNQSAYGFRASSISANSVSNGDDCQFSVFKYFDLGGTFSDTYIGGMGESVYFVYNQHDVTFSYSFMHNGVPTIFQLAGASRILLEYNWIGPGWGKVAIRGGNGSESDGNIYRYNVFRNSAQLDPVCSEGGCGLTSEIAIWHNSNEDTASIDGNEIYGNVFYSVVTGGRNSVIIVGGNGTSWLGQSANNTKVYNNTIVGMAENPTEVAILINGGTGNEVRNNLYYDITGGDPGESANTTANNEYVTSDPFVNYAGLDFHLAAGIAGGSLGSPYNEDMDGVTRGADATFDVGALEFEE